MNSLYEAQLWIDRAEDTLMSSEINFKNELFVAAVNRAYYAMFYSANALLRS
jgi:uncharacterized protein (UPF0332 family)